MSTAYDDSVVRKIEESAERHEMIEASLEGLTNDQIRAIPRLVMWFCGGGKPHSSAEYWNLRDIFPQAP